MENNFRFDNPEKTKNAQKQMRIGQLTQLTIWNHKIKFYHK